MKPEKANQKRCKFENEGGQSASSGSQQTSKRDGETESYKERPKKRIHVGAVDMVVNDDEEEELWRAWTVDYMEVGGEVAYDDVTGEQVNADEVRRARKEEMEFVTSIPVYEEADGRKQGRVQLLLSG